ncbi:MAG TPA: cytochrome c oxidase subunit II [Rhizomicrobium sp.]|nr:cytochrome c oxidase subunit II [Rhizomicrobium sp.]
MSFRKTAIGVGVATGALAWATSALALPYNYEMGMQPAASPVMERIESFHTFLLYIIVAVSLFVLALLIWIILRYNARANPVPSKTHHNSLLEVIWTIVPVIILVIIAVPSFKLLYYEAELPKPQPDLTIRVIGKQWYWTYQYPASNLSFDSNVLSKADAEKAGKVYLLAVDNVVVVPVNKVVAVDVTGADVIHSWAVPQFGVKMDAVPGRINRTWFLADRIGTFYGECSELCGPNHDAMPIEVHVVSDADFAKWLADAKKNTKVFSPIAMGETTRLAAQ